MWGMRRRLGSEEQIPRDRSKGRMRHITRYPLLEDCGKTKWSSVTFWSWPCIPGEASRLWPAQRSRARRGWRLHQRQPRTSGRGTRRSKRQAISAIRRCCKNCAQLRSRSVVRGNKDTHAWAADIPERQIVAPFNLAIDSKLHRSDDAADRRT